MKTRMYENVEVYVKSELVGYVFWYESNGKKFWGSTFVNGGTRDAFHTKASAVSFLKG